MIKSYSIANARDRFTGIVRDIEKEPAVQITRRGQPVAVLLSWREYQRLKTRVDFGEAYRKFRERFDLSKLDIEPEVFTSLRDQSPGREVNL